MMDQNNDGWGPTVNSSESGDGWGPVAASATAQPNPDANPDAQAQPGMLAYVNSLTSNGVDPDKALQMATSMPQYKDVSNKFSFKLGADGKTFEDNATPTASNDEAGWGPVAKGVNNPPDDNGKVQAPTSGPVEFEQNAIEARENYINTVDSNVSQAYQASKAVVGQDIANIGKNAAPRQMTPEEFQAANDLGLLPAKGMTPELATFGPMAPAGQAPSPTVNLPSDSTIQDPIGRWMIKSAPANLIKGAFLGPEQERNKYNQIHEYIAQKAILDDPKSSEDQKKNAQDTINQLKQPDESLGKFINDLHTQYKKDPQGLAISLYNSIITDPELVGSGAGKAGTALSDAAKAAGASQNVVKSMQRLEATVHGAIQGSLINTGISAAQGLSTPTGVVTAQSLGTAATVGAALGGALGAMHGASASGHATLEPDPDMPGWSKPAGPSEPTGPKGLPGTGQKLLTSEDVPGEFTSTAQKRLGAPGDTKSGPAAGEPIPTNTPIDDTGTVGLTGGTSEDLKGLHIDEDFPNTLQMKNRSGQDVTVPVKDIVAQIHEAEEGPLMHPNGPVPIDKVMDIVSRAGEYGNTDIFSAPILKKIMNGESLGYVDAHNIATAIENQHVDSNYDIDPIKVYQPAMIPHIKDIQAKAEANPGENVPATLGNMPYEDSNLSHLVDGQDKPSVGGLPEAANDEGWGPLHENNASGESSASMEAINRLQEERAQGRDRFLINRDGSVEPVIGVDGVDKVARPGQVIVQRNIGKDEWTILSHGDDVSPDVAQGTVNRARPKLAQAGKVDPKLLIALGAGALGALAGAYIYNKHPVKGAMTGAALAMMAAGSHPIKFLQALKGAISGDKRINISSFLDTRDGMMADSGRARMQAQNHLATIIPSKQERINVDNYLDDPRRYPNVTAKEKQAADYIRNVYDSLGKVAMQHGVLDDMIKDYNSRRWQQGPNTKSVLAQILAAKQKASPTGTTSVHNINRVFVTKAEGKAAGLTPVTEDAIANLGMYWDSMTRTIANKVTMDSLKNTKIPGTQNSLVMPAIKAPPDYVSNDRLPGFRVHPDIAQTLASVYHLTDTNPFLNGLQAVNTLQKRTAVMGSLFHVVNMAQAHYSANSFFTPLKNTKDIVTSLFGKSAAHDMLKTGRPTDGVGQLLRGGMKIQLPGTDGIDIDYNQQYYPAINAVQGYMNSVLPGSGKLMGGLKRVSELSDRFIFTNAHAGFKMSTGLTVLSQMKLNWAKAQQADPSVVIPSDEHLAAQAASFVNNIYGGLDWRRAAEESQTELGRMLTYAAYGPVGRSLLSFAFFAPDWLLSTMRSFGKAFGTGTYLRRINKTGTPAEMMRHIGGTGLGGFVRPKTATDFHRLYQVRNTVYFFMIASALNYHFSGHGLTDNKNPLRVDMGNGEYMEYNKHGTEAFNALENPRQFFLNKLGFIPKELAEWALNKDYLTVSGHAPAYSGIMTHIANTFTPFTISNMLNKSPRDIALNIAGMPVYGITDTDKALHHKQAEEKIKQERRDAPETYRERRRDAAERRRED
jgi:hypothetical protein